MSITCTATRSASCSNSSSGSLIRNLACSEWPSIFLLSHSEQVPVRLHVPPQAHWRWRSRPDLVLLDTPFAVGTASTLLIDSIPFRCCWPPPCRCHAVSPLIVCVSVPPTHVRGALSCRAAPPLPVQRATGPIVPVALARWHADPRRGNSSGRDGRCSQRLASYPPPGFGVREGAFAFCRFGMRRL